MNNDRSLHLMRDVADGQLLAADGRRLGRVADLAATLRPDGSLEISAILIGPAALARRLSNAGGRLVTRLGARRFERIVPVSEVKEFGSAIRLRSDAAHYDLADGDDWAGTILRFIPGSGWAGRATRAERGRLPPLEGGRRVWIANLIGSQVRSASGESLGRLVDLGATRGAPHRVTTLLMGRAGWLDRLKAGRVATLIATTAEPDAIRWQRVANVGADGEITLR